MYKNILLDLDDTILDFHKAEHNALKKALKELGVEPSDKIVSRYSEINAEQWRLLEEGKFTRAEILIRRFELLLLEFGIDINAEEANALYKHYLGIGHYFIDEAEELLKRLSSRCLLYLVSNGNMSVQEGRIKSAGIAHYFREMFISDMVGYDKPAKEFFEYCFKRIPNFKREETVIIGDSLTSDIKGGNNAGIATCWFNPHHKKRREDIFVDYEVSELNMIPDVLDLSNTS